MKHKELMESLLGESDKIKLNEKEEELEFKKLSSPDKDGYITVIMSTKDGREVYPIMFHKKLGARFANKLERFSLENVKLWFE